MRVSLPAGIAIGLAALFSVFHLVLGVASLATVSEVGPVLTCMALYAAASGVAIFLPGRPLPVWAACFSLATALVMPVIAAPVVDLTDKNDSTTWWVAAVGTLMVVLVVRGRRAFAWVGVVFVTLFVVVWAGPGAFGDLGLVGDLTWVAVATGFAVAMDRATRTTQEFLRAEQETADWQAAQDAHVFERQFRLSQTTRMALPMLERVIERDGDLTDDERAECLHLEQAIRDEIRGRSLLSDDVRDEVMRLRRRGATVQLHDDGGLDDLEADDLRRVHAEIAEALRGARDADNVIVRTVAEGSEAAVTIVGLRLDTAASESAALGAGLDDEDEDEDDSVVLWTEIPRRAAV
ncbi:hypothetical protein NS263_08525 [Curtobacterium oceanosedimentum]|uniref:Signal transduction histidine kinase subgroup 3 dimerisation and phosphoacceptor domain-containing protein n=1 Tax=Curtobacterium oceanosedimentum TaxID=465820 RepID=A0ABR5S696_9MICO|nr:hypothetical protein [Curtobacterium oceanosedimentum]KTR40147.1 hypothetical protein NS263_08525 [Curtobacterium oceanosedimentum]